MATKKATKRTTKPATRTPARRDKRGGQSSTLDIDKLLGQGWEEETEDAQVEGFLAPEPGVEVAFKYVRRVDGTNADGEPTIWHVCELLSDAPLVDHSEAKDGERGMQIGVGHIACLRRKFDEAKPGDCFAVLFGEKKKLQGGRAMHTAKRIAVRRAGPSTPGKAGKGRGKPASSQPDGDEDEIPF